MEETQKRVETIVLNSNILFSSLIKGRRVYKSGIVVS